MDDTYDEQVDKRIAIDEWIEQNIYSIFEVYMNEETPTKEDIALLPHLLAMYHAIKTEAASFEVKQASEELRLIAHQLHDMYDAFASGTASLSAMVGIYGTDETEELKKTLHNIQRELEILTRTFTEVAATLPAAKRPMNE